MSHTTNDDSIEAKQARIKELEGALRRSPCPYPIWADDGTVADCIMSGHCGCENGAVLAKPDEPGPWPQSKEAAMWTDVAECEAGFPDAKGVDHG